MRRREFITLIGGAATWPLVVRAQTLLAATAGERFLHSLRTAAFDKLQALPLGYFEEERTGALVSRLTSDVQALTEFLREALVEVVGSALQIVLTATVLVILSPTLAAVSLVALPLLTASSWAFHHSAGRVYHAIRDRVAETLTALQEGLSGVRVVQAFRRERQTLAAYEPRSRAQIGAWRSASYVNIRLFTVIPLAQTIALVAVLLVAASMYRDGSISEGTIVEGQGTNTIKVDTNGLAGQTVRASLSMGGYGSLLCSAECGVSIPVPKINARKFDEYPDIARNDEKARLDNLVIELQNDPTATAHVIIHPGRNGRRGEVQEHAKHIVDYLVNSRGLDEHRIVTLVGSPRNELFVELWLTPRGATPPNP